MRASKALLLAGLAVAMGAVQASSSTSLRVSLTITERCDISRPAAGPSIECSRGVPWTLAPADAGPAGLYPVPAATTGSAPAATIVF